MEVLYMVGESENVSSCLIWDKISSKRDEREISEEAAAVTASVSY